MSSRATKGAHQPEAVAEPFLYAQVEMDKAGNPTPSTREATHHAGASSSNGFGEQRSYDKGLADGEARARAAFDKKLAEVRSEISVALREFTVQREDYFLRVESEVVQLALSIAKKLLHREAKIDPMMLTGVVRVALESVNDGTQVRIRTNPEEIRFWREYFHQAADISPTPELIGDTSLEAGSCVLETDLGSTLVNFDTQLQEIEKGFLDLLEHRPRTPQ